MVMRGSRSRFGDYLRRVPSANEILGGLTTAARATRAAPGRADRAIVSRLPQPPSGGQVLGKTWNAADLFLSSFAEAAGARVIDMDKPLARRSFGDFDAAEAVIASDAGFFDKARALRDIHQERPFLQQVGLGLLDPAAAVAVGRGLTTAASAVIRGGKPAAAAGALADAPLELWNIASNKLAGYIRNAEKLAADIEPSVAAAQKQKNARILKTLESSTLSEAQTRITAAGRQAIGALPKAETVAPIARNIGTELKPNLVPIKVLDPGEFKALFGRIEDYTLESGRGFTMMQADTALKKLVLGKDPIVKSDLKVLNEVFGGELAEAASKMLPKHERYLSVAFRAMGLPRELLASTDFSAPGRQGWFLAPSQPKEWIDNARSSVKMAFNEDYYREIDTIIRNNPNFSRYTSQWNLAIHERVGFGSDIGNVAEAYSSGYGKQIPFAGKVIEGSERAYVGFLNKYRMDIMDSLVSKFEVSGVAMTTREGKRLAAFINHATGRGTAPWLGEGNFAIIAHPFFSLRYQLSRFQLAGDVGQSVYRLMRGSGSQVDREISKYVAEAAVRWFVTNSIIMTALASAPIGGITVGLRRDSSDFGKIRQGEMKYDIWGGYAQYARAMSQMQSRVYEVSGTGLTKGPGGYIPSDEDVIRKKQRQDKTFLRLARSKLNPFYSIIWDTMAETNMVGEPTPRFLVPGDEPSRWRLRGGSFQEIKQEGREFRPIGIGEEAWVRLAPIVAQDMWDAFQAEGPPGLLKASPAIFGVGVGTYPDRGTVTEDIYPGALYHELNDRAKKRVDNELERRRSGDRVPTTPR
jgi:hypothetical protein